MDPPYSRADTATKKQAITQYVTDGTPIGILAYDENHEPIAWCSVAPLESHKNLRTRTYKLFRKRPPKRLVHQLLLHQSRTTDASGLTTQLIKAAINYAKQNGAQTIEAYPVDYDSPSYTYMGRIGTFQRLGFKEIGMVRHPPPHDEVIRLTDALPQAQTGSLPSQRLNEGCSPLASVSLASVHNSFQITGSCNSLSGLLRLRATNPRETRPTRRLPNRVVPEVETPPDPVAVVRQRRVHRELRHEQRIALLQRHRNRLPHLELRLRYLQPRLQPIVKTRTVRQQVRFMRIRHNR